MRAIIPAKASSERVPDKNWRPFHAGKSLVDINIEALIGCGFAPADIYVSCECSDRLASVQASYGITPLLRSPSLCANDVPLTDWIRAICRQVPGDDDIAWSQVCDPLFREHRGVLLQWQQCRGEHDSLCVVNRAPHYLLDAGFRPLGWGFGEWHVPSQRLQPYYFFPFTMSVLTRASIARTGYHVGWRPSFYVASGRSIDIDTLEDFELAQAMYSQALRERPPPSTPLRRIAVQQDV